LQARSKRFDLLLLLRDCRFQLRHFAVLFEELIELHRVHLVVAHGVGFPLCPAPLDRDSPFLHLRPRAQAVKCLAGLYPSCAESDWHE
jgi:hypothetical protein